MVEILGTIIVAALVLLWFIKRPKKGVAQLLFKLTFNNITIKGNIMAVSMTSTQFVEGILQPVDKKGRPAKVDEGSVTFTSSDEDIFTVTQDENNELSVTITAVGEGVAQLDYTADADLGEGIVTITGFMAVEVLPALAAGFSITFGTPQEQPESGTTTTTTTF